MDDLLKEADVAGNELNRSASYFHREAIKIEPRVHQVLLKLLKSGELTDAQLGKMAQAVYDLENLYEEIDELQLTLDEYIEAVKAVIDEYE